MSPYQSFSILLTLPLSSICGNFLGLLQCKSSIGSSKRILFIFRKVGWLRKKLNFCLRNFTSKPQRLQGINSIFDILFAAISNKFRDLLYFTRCFFYKKNSPMFIFECTNREQFTTNFTFQRIWYNRSK